MFSRVRKILNYIFFFREIDITEEIISLIISKL